MYGDRLNVSPRVLRHGLAVGKQLFALSGRPFDLVIWYNRGMPKPFIIPKLASAVVGPTVQDVLRFTDHDMVIVRPASADHLLDLNSTHHAFSQDEYLPYWATLWPTAEILAAYLLSFNWKQDLKAIELGCGLGVCGIAGLLSGLDVTFTDYDQTALSFAEENARINGWPQVKAMTYDWRCPLGEAFDVVLASDILYERRNIGPLVETLKALMAVGGEAIIADPNRPYGQDFTKALLASGFDYERAPQLRVVTDGKEVAATIYRIKRR